MSEAFVFDEAGAMLSDREKFVLHFVSTMTISKITGIGRENRDVLINGMIEDVRRHRCRSIAPEDVKDILEEINEEMICGKIMFQHWMGDQISSDACPVFDGTGKVVHKSDVTEPCIACGKPKKDHNFKEMSDCEWSVTGKRPNTNTKPKIFRWRDMRWDAGRSLIISNFRWLS